MVPSLKVSVTSRPAPTLDVVHLAPADGLRPEGIGGSEFSGKTGQRLVLHPEQRRECWTGIGPSEDVSENLIRKEVGAAVRKLVETGSSEVSVLLHDYTGFAGAAVEGAILSTFKFEEFLPPARRASNHLRKLVVVVANEDTKRVRRSVNAATALAESTNLARRVGDTPPNRMTPAALAGEAKTAAAAWGLKCRVWTETALQKEGFGGLMAVGGGSANPPRLIRLDYDCGNKKAPTLCVIGKAVTFDTGGISIKGRAGMAEMKWDKMGGCAALGVAVAVARLKVPVNVTILIPSAENMPDGKSYRPGDILSLYGGSTVEVLDTDAEGRLILGDALAYAATKVKPDAAITMATLTGACIVALGNDRAGLFCHNRDWVDTCQRLGEATGDRVWHLPHDDEFAKAMESKIAAIKNLGPREAGASTAASFLQFFAGDMPLLHLDIAGPAQMTRDQPDRYEGASGFGVRLVSRFAEQFGQGSHRSR